MAEQISPTICITSLTAENPRPSLLEIKGQVKIEVTGHRSQVTTMFVENELILMLLFSTHTHTAVKMFYGSVLYM